MPVTQPVKSSVPLRQCIREVADAHPTVEVHLEVELLGEMTEDASHPAGDAVTLAAVHHELPFIVAGGAEYALEVPVKSALSNHVGAADR